MKIIEHPSPNYDSRDGQSVDMLVLHYTGMASAEQALQRLCDATVKASAHYMVDEDGTVYRLVPEEMRAWHAGVSFWRGQTNINQRSIGIEMVNPGHEFGYRAFPEPQMRAVAALCKDVLMRHAIPPRNIVAHSDIAPARKEDPGELFDWKWLAGQGIGLFPEGEGGASRRVRGCLKEENASNKIPPHPNTPPHLSDEGLPGYVIYSSYDGAKAERGRGLERYGYDTTDPAKAILAFQRHFHPERLSNQWDAECEALLAELLAMV